MFDFLVKISALDALTIAALCYLLYFVVYLYVQCLMNTTIRLRELSVHLFFFALAMGIIGFYITYSDPGPDLERHWHEWHIVHGDSGPGIQAARIAQIAANGLLLWDGFLLLSSYLGDVHFLAGIIVFFNYMFFWQSCMLVCRKYKPTYREFMLYLVLKIGLVSWFHLFSGLRNVFAFSAAGYALLLDCWKTKKTDWVKTIFALLCAVLTHLAGYFFVFFFIAHHFIRKRHIKKIMYFVLCTWGYFVFLFSKIFSLLPFDMFALMGKKLVRYYGLRADAALKPWLVFCTLIFFVAMGCHLLYLHVQNKKIAVPLGNERNSYFDYMTLMETFVLGGILMPTVIMRMIYLVGFTIFPLVLESRSIKCKRHYFALLAAELFLCALMAAYNFRGIQCHMHLESVDYSFINVWRFL